MTMLATVTPLRSDSASDTAVVDWFMAEMEAAERLREPSLELQAELLSFYMNYRKQPLPQGLEWMSPELLADSFLLIESGLPSIAQNVFDGKSVSVYAHTLAGSQVSQALDKANYQMRRRAGFEFESIPAVRNCGIFGHQFQKNVWVTQWGTRRYPIFSNPTYDAYGEMVSGGRIVDYEYRDEKIFDGPRTYYPDNAKVWKSAATDALGNPLVWVEEVIQNLDYMRQVNADYKAVYGKDLYRHLADLEIGGDQTPLARRSAYRGNDGFGVTARRRSATEQASGLSPMILEGENAVITRHGWARVPEYIKDYGDEPQERLVVFTPDGLILRDVPMPTWNMMAPFHDIMFMRVANEPFGRTPLQWAIGEIEQRSEMRNLRLAEAWLNIFQVRVANRDANFDQNDFVNMPGAVWMYDHDEMRPQDVIQVLQRQPVFQEIYREDALMEDHINRVMGSTPNMQGEGLGSRATLGEAQLVDSRAGGRSDLISKQLAWQLEIPQSRDYIGMFTKFSEEPLEVQVDGEDQSFPIRIFAQEIDFEYDVEINAGEYGVMNWQRVNALREALGAAFSDPDFIRYDFDARRTMSAYQSATGMPNSLRPQAEADMRRQQDMMMQIAAQQAEGQQ